MSVNESRTNLKKLIASAILCFSILFPGWIKNCPAETLYLFYPTTTSSAAMQSQLKNSFPDIDLTVFARHKDFSSQVKLTPPDAVLTKLAVIKSLPDYTVIIQGSRSGSNIENYVLMSVDAAVDPGGLTDITIGVLDILGRYEMKNFVGEYIKPTPKLKRVTKVEDLLPLLTFDMAKAILIPENQQDYFKSISNMNFVSVPVPGMKIGIVNLGVKQGANVDKIINAVKNMRAEDLALFEVDKWKE